MKVHLNQIPYDGLHLEGEDPATILELNDPLMKPKGPVQWSLDIGLSDGGLFATGSLAVDLEAECVACLTKFDFPVRIENFATQVELTASETVDLTDQEREDILLALPAHPHCDWNGQNVCKGAKLKAAEPEAPGEPQPTWSELDKLKFKSN